MKLKLDENLGAQPARALGSAGHDTATVQTQKLCSASDRDLITACKLENRCLVTLDLDFANPLLFKPQEYPGIAVLRLPPKPARDDLLLAVNTLLSALDRADIRGKLWIVEIGRIREYQPE